MTTNRNDLSHYYGLIVGVSQIISIFANNFPICHYFDDILSCRMAVDERKNE